MAARPAYPLAGIGVSVMPWEPSCTRRAPAPSSRYSRVERVLMDLAILHNDQEVLGRILDQPDVFEGIAVDEQQIGERALLHHAQLPRVGIAWTGQARQLAIDRGCHPQDFSV